MKKTFIIVSLLFLLMITFYSCKKQDEPSPETLYDTLVVNSAYTVHTLKESTILTLNATMNDAISYLWMPGGEITPMINITTEGNYSVRINTHSQEFNYEVLVLFEGSDCYVPNSFSPNNDGINDTWHPCFSLVNSDNYSLNIFDKDNLKLFSSDDINAAWDGYYGGNLMPTAYYYYVISYQTMSGETKNRNGMIQLVL
jgi:gliding motility-associated-like protein